MASGNSIVPLKGGNRALRSSSSLIGGDFDAFWDAPHAFNAEAKGSPPGSSTMSSPSLQSAADLLDIFDVKAGPPSATTPPLDRVRPYFSTSVDLSEVGSTGRALQIPSPQSASGEWKPSSSLTPSSLTQSPRSKPHTPLSATSPMSFVPMSSSMSAVVSGVVSPSSRMNVARLASLASRTSKLQLSITKAVSSSVSGGSGIIGVVGGGVGGGGCGGSCGIFAVRSADRENMSLRADKGNGDSVEAASEVAMTTRAAGFAEERQRAAKVECRLRDRMAAIVVLQRQWRVGLGRKREQQRLRDRVHKSELLRLVIIQRRRNMCLAGYCRRWKGARRRKAGAVITGAARHTLGRMQATWQRSFTCCGRLTLEQANRLFSAALGWRVRRLMRSPRVQSHLLEMRDLKALVQDASDQLVADENCPRTADVGVYTIIGALRLGKPDAERDLTFFGPGLVDWPFLRSIVRQINCCRGHFRATAIDGARWHRLPVPGYLDLSPVLTAILRTERALAAKASAAMPQRPVMLSPRQASSSSSIGGGSGTINYKPVQRSPPSIGRSEKAAAWALLNQDHDGMTHSPVPNSGAPGERPISSPHPYVVSTPVTSLTSFMPAPASASPSADGVAHDSASASPDPILPLSLPPRLLSPPVSAVSGAASPAASPSLSAKRPQAGASTSLPLSVSKRSGERAHLQIDILGADGLVSPRRAPNRASVEGASNTQTPQGDSNRKPFLRLSLLLPKSTTGPRDSSAGSMEMKRVQQWTREYAGEDATYPRWSHTISMPLPCPRSLLESGPGEGETQEDMLARQNKLLLDWWAGGCIKIDVVDSERFNTDTFLGEATLLLSSFLAPGVLRKAAVDGSSHLNGSLPLETMGALELRKKTSADRVSGVLHCKAYLHLFNKAHTFDSPPPRPSPAVVTVPISLAPNRFQMKHVPRGSPSGNSAGSLSPPMPPPPPRSGNSTNGTSSALSSSLATTAAAAAAAAGGGDMKRRVREQVKDRIKERITTRCSMVASVTKCLDSLADVQQSAGVKKRNSTRSSMVASVTKCLDSLADVQQSTDGLLSHFGRKLELKKGEGEGEGEGEGDGESDGGPYDLSSAGSLSAAPSAASSAPSSQVSSPEKDDPMDPNSGADSSHDSDPDSDPDSEPDPGPESDHGECEAEAGVTSPSRVRAIKRASEPVLQGDAN